MATIAAACYVGSTPSQKTRQTFAFRRYKGSISIQKNSRCAS